MLLKNLIKLKSSNFKLLKIRGLNLDSRKVKKGDLFFALKGNKLNGEKFINQAINKGAVAVVCSTNKKIQNYSVPIIKVKNVRNTLGYACAQFFKNKPKNIIAVTGTNGKSSVADFFHQILLLNKVPVATIGTLGIKKNKVNKRIDLTSPDIITLHKKLSELKKARIDNVIIEASSHGLEQGRLNNINFKVGIFTNFSQDHIDYHKTMKKYLTSKLILFSSLLKTNSHVITDESIKEFSKIKKIANRKKLKILTINKKFIDNYKKSTNLIGSFQIRNLCMSILAANISGVSMKKINYVLKRINSVNGRLELIRELPNNSKVFVDYAHTPDALLTILKSVKNYYRENITLVFGCGGDRDKKKRSLMAKIAREYCKKIYVTDDNPRNENPQKIRSSITRFLNKKNYIEIGNRTKAIQLALKNSEPFEIIVIAGKGHETHQDYGNKIIQVSDKKIIKKVNLKNKRFKKNKFILSWNSQILKKILKKKRNYKFRGVSINSKEVKKENLFIAIKGLKKDGHDYISQAIEKGANYCVVSQRNRKINKNKTIFYKNTYKFLNKIALIKRKKSSAKFIAITGSSGKTTFKTLLGNLLNLFSKTYFSPRSFNNHYGVPISLSNIENYHKYGVFEIGMSKKGEINRLSKIVKPDIAIITNTAEAHIENFKNIKGIAEAKGEIIKNINKGGTLILNRDDRFFNYHNTLAKNQGLKTISFGRSNKSDIYPVSIKKFEKKTIIKIHAINETLFFSFSNLNIYNVLSSIAVLKDLNLNLNQAIKSFQNFNFLEGRGKIHNIKRFKIIFNLIDESYNANPFSVKNAINNLSNLKRKNSKKYLLLGDMLELGNKSDFYHKSLSKVINNTDIDKVFVYGDKILNTYKYIKNNKRGNILQYKNDFDTIFRDIIKKGDLLMVKGSNATGLNKLTSNIIKGKENVI